ncbi:MAG: adenine deaminase [Candidatus Kapaibacterium sp.]|nr:MAG: adenine deaminase [Candidatus Kapabacteria bacterium]
MLVNLHARTIRGAEVVIDSGKITEIRENEHQYGDAGYDRYLLPGYVDAHVHVESSMLVPSEFARMAVVHGSVGTVSDPHEIANVLGIAGVRYMLENAALVPFKFNFGAPSCVPATSFETAGAVVTAADIRELFEKDGLKYLSEMMNFPGVLFRDEEVMEKIRIAHELKKPVDGHAPGLRADKAQSYIEAGISTDHECFTLEEALEKVGFGMKILIREGSAAKNYTALESLISSHPALTMFCSDDKHPNDLAVSHIDEVVRRSVALGHDVFDVLRCASVNPVEHYGLEIGLLRQGDWADFIVVDNLRDFRTLHTYINGVCVAQHGKTLIARQEAGLLNNFACSPKNAEDFRCAVRSESASIRVIEALDGQLITNEIHCSARIIAGAIESDAERDILKMTVVNRYANTPPAVCFIKNFGLKRGAIASCVGHDSHNIIAVGTSDTALTAAVNAIIAAQGGICVVDDAETAKEMEIDVLPLPVAGIMTNADGYAVGEAYSRLDAKAKALGTRLGAPFMTLSFMALLVIPDLKLSDKGLFSGAQFAFTPLVVEA